VLVVSRPNGDATELDATRGVGIAGMKERARLAGGWLTAGPEGEEFLVTAFIPVPSYAPEAVLAHA
jgi:signal transduction histidine kinase